MDALTPPQFRSIDNASFAALRRRWPAIAESVRGAVSDIQPRLPVDVPEVMRRLAPTQSCVEPLLLAGSDLPLWLAVCALPCKVPQMPTHRPPLYFLARAAADLADLLTTDCSAMLLDPRVQLFLGEDAVAQASAFQLGNPQIPAARLAATIDPALFAAGESAEQLWPRHLEEYNRRLETSEAQLAALRSRMMTESRLSGLRILGLSSRYTTFLQHSMRDWLEGMRDLGHETELIIESFDHELGNPLSIARAALQFQPDVIVMIDHYRDELRGLPKQVPFVMWVQDELNGIFCSDAGAAQGKLDFCLGFGRLHLRDRCGYPERRFLPSPIGVNPRRFSLPSEKILQYDCDLAFVSHASASATSLLETQLIRSDAEVRKVLIEIFDWLKATYDAQRCIAHASQITRFIDATLNRRGVRLPNVQRRQFDELFIQRINNALFRHQALQWAAASGLRLQLWGRGWEQHARLRKFAKGQACNESQLREIYQRSAINLQVVPTGAVHQRLLDGLAAGGFFLLRGTAGDRVETLYRRLWERCSALAIASSIQIKSSDDAEVRGLLSAIEALLDVNPLELSADLFDVLQLSADSGFIRSAASVWPEYEQVAFDSPKNFSERVQQYLTDSDARQARIQSMRQVVVERFAYASISGRLLAMIGDQFAAENQPLLQAA